MQNTDFDVVVIGSGPGGYRAAVRLALLKKRVAIIEREQWGGCCLNRGCVPKKAWHHSAKLIAASSEFALRGIQGTLKGDLLQAWRHQQQVVNTVRDSYLNYLQRLGVQRFFGHGSLLGANRVLVQSDDGSKNFTTQNIILASGSRANIPDHLPLQSGKVLTTDELFNQEPPPGNRVALIGSGVIATEFVFILSQLGNKISWYSRSGMLSASAFSPQARGALSDALAVFGIESPNLQIPEKIEPKGDTVALHFADGDIQEVDWVLLATGRKPVTDGLGLENTSISVDSRGFIERNEFLQTNEPTIYAIGDCTSPAMTANQALADANIAAENIVFGNREEQTPEWVPQTIYSAVELVRIGLDEDTAEDEGFEPAVGFASFVSSPRALGQDDTEGFVRVLADMDSGELLGGEIVGNEAGELVHLFGDNESAPHQLHTLLHRAYNHPSRAEELFNAIETMAGKWGLDKTLFG